MLTGIIQEGWEMIIYPLMLRKKINAPQKQYAKYVYMIKIKENK